jgi:hypothetical protein
MAGAGPTGDEPLDTGPYEVENAYGDPPAAAGPPGVEHGRSKRTWVIVGTAAVVLAVGGFLGAKAFGGGSSNTTASAQSGQGQGSGQGRRLLGRGTFGTLQSVDGPTLTLATPNSNGGTTTVVTSSSTRFVKAVTGAFNDIKVGDRITAMGTAAGTDEVAAQRISDMGAMQLFGGQGRRNGNPPNGGTRPTGGTGPNGTFNRPDPNTFANGTVKSISGTTLTVTQNDGTTKTVTTSGSTTISVLKTVTIADLTTGQPVVVLGPTSSDGTVNATTVEQGVAGFGGGLGRRFGGGQGGGPGPGGD